MVANDEGRSELARNRPPGRDGRAGQLRTHDGTSFRSMLNDAASLARVDFCPQSPQPSVWRVLVAALASAVGSLVGDAIVVALGQAMFPATKGYSHFQFSAYAKLTLIGVIIASAAWPIVTRVTSAPRWLFLRLAIVVTIVLWLPDVYLLYKGEPAQAVAVLMIMHVVIAAVTYDALVHLAPVGPDRLETDGRPLL